jgi:hypothetical protein
MKLLPMNPAPPVTRILFGLKSSIGNPFPRLDIGWQAPPFLGSHVQ